MYNKNFNGRGWQKAVLGTVVTVAVGTSGFVYSLRSLNNVKETQPAMVALTDCALNKSLVDFVVIDGGRSDEEHANNLKKGVSWIKRSKHQDGLAVDVAAYVDGKITYDPHPYSYIAGAFYFCSEKLGIPVTWGGEWKVRDLMHFETVKLEYIDNRWVRRD